MADKGPGRTRRAAASERTAWQLRLGCGRRGGMTGWPVTRGHRGWGSKVTTSQLACVGSLNAEAEHATRLAYGQGQQIAATELTIGLSDVVSIQGT